MKFKINKIYYIAAALFATAFIAGCQKPYNPPVVSSPGSYLVVEGDIVTGTSDSTIIKLSHTISLSGATTSAVETGAQISVQDAGGKSYPLQETTKGYYAAAPLNLSASGNYRLVIKRANGSTYQSDYVQAKSSLPIDSVSFTAPKDGLHVYVNSHDPANLTRYYRWEFQENWEFHTYYQSSYIAVDTIVRQRTPAEQVYYCYQSQKSTSIYLGSTADLAQDVVSQQPITYVPSSSEKLSYIYSIQVKQHALSKEAFNFWQLLKKNTENLGSIFDAQPSQLTGNIHNTANASEPVIGYISAGAVASKRLFIDRAVVRTEWIHYDDPPCKPDTLYYAYYPPGAKTPENQVKDFILTHELNAVYAIVPPGSNKIVGFIASTPQCTDCTTRGTTVKPSFWPY